MPSAVSNVRLSVRGRFSSNANIYTTKPPRLYVRSYNKASTGKATIILSFLIPLTSRNSLTFNFSVLLISDHSEKNDPSILQRSERKKKWKLSCKPLTSKLFRFLQSSHFLPSTPIYFYSSPVSHPANHHYYIPLIPLNSVDVFIFPPYLFFHLPSLLPSLLLSIHFMSTLRDFHMVILHLPLLLLLLLLPPSFFPSPLLLPNLPKSTTSSSSYSHIIYLLYQHPPTVPSTLI